MVCGLHGSGGAGEGISSKVVIEGERRDGRLLLR